MNRDNTAIAAHRVTMEFRQGERTAGSLKELLLRGQGRAGALLMAAEGHGFEDVTRYFDHLMEHLGWKNLGRVLAGGNENAGDIQGKPELQQAYALGQSIS